MKIQKLSEEKQLLIWLTKADQEDEEIMSEADRIRSTYKANNWLVITFKSGAEDPFKCIVDLLRYNRDRAIKKESNAEYNKTAEEMKKYRYLAVPIVEPSAK